MADQALPSPELLRKLLRYEPDTGKLFWLERTAETEPRDVNRRRFNTRYAGSEAFTATSAAGYRVGHLGGQVRLAHRVIWAMAHGEWPKETIDHIDGNPANNCLSNLRPAAHHENHQNRAVSRANKSGFTGVLWDQRGYWTANIVLNKKRIWLGCFSTAEAAGRAYEAGKAKYHTFAPKLRKPQDGCPDGITGT